MEKLTDIRDDVRDLRGKYGEILAMRIEHASGSEDEALARARMAALASRFPGALRELDRLELAVIRARIAELDAVLAGAAAAPWMPAMARFHALARGALCAKRWLAGRKRIDPTVATAYAAHAVALAFPAEAMAWVRALDRIAAPPRGRIMDAVVTRVAHEQGLTERHARRLIYGEPRRARPA